MDKNILGDFEICISVPLILLIAAVIKKSLLLKIIFFLLTGAIYDFKMVLYCRYRFIY